MIKKVILSAFIVGVTVFRLAAAEMPAAETAKLPERYTRDAYPVEREDLSAIDFNSYGFPYYTGSVFPEAQRAVYADTFIPLKDVSIVLGAGLSKEDMRLTVLLKKLEKWGVKAEMADKVSGKKTQILLNVPGFGAPAPEKAEGYAIRCVSQDGKDLIAVNGHDKRGLLWGIVSVLQLTKRDASGVAMRSAEINDYPEAAVRGFLSKKWPRVYEFMLFTKMNCVVIQEAAHEGGWDRWRTPGPLLLDMKQLGDIFHELDLDCYASLHPAASSPKFIASHAEDFKQMLYVIETYYAANHLNFYWGYDDIRFPLPPQDKEKYGSAAETDAYAMNRIYQEIHKKYPDFKMVFCPPFYSTSGINKDDGGESGNVYAKTIGAKIDPAVNFFWTGRLVVTHEFPKWSVDEVSKLIARKPWIFANRQGMHMGNWPFVTDAYPWDKRGYAGFLQDIGTFACNTWGAIMSTMIATSGDYMWNAQAYDAARSAKTVEGLLLGPDLFPILQKMDDQLRLFDPYGTRNHGLQANALSAVNLAQLEAAMREVDDLYAQVQRMNKDGLDNLTCYGRLIDMAKDLVKASKSPKLLAELPAESVRPIAVKETAFNSLKDPFFTVLGMKGGFVMGFVPSADGERYAKLIYGAKTGYSTLMTLFAADPFPPSDDFELCISGRSFFASADCKMIVKVNDQVVYEGASGFSKTGWSLKKIIIPVRAIKKYNTLSISNGEDADKLEAPCLGVSYVVIKEP